MSQYDDGYIYWATPKQQFEGQFMTSVAYKKKHVYRYSEINNFVATCFQKWSNVWNKTFENKLIAKDHRVQNKWTDYKILELKYANRNIIR